MKLKNKKMMKRLLMILLIIGVSVGYVFRVIAVNTEYPNPHTVYIPVGTSLDLGNMTSLKIIHSELLSQEEIENRFTLADNVGSYEWQNGFGRHKIFLITLEFTNHSTEVLEMPLHRICVEAGAWANGMSSLYQYLQETSDDIFMAEPGETLSIIMPFSAYEIMFYNKEDYNTLSLQNTVIAPTLFPTKYCMELL